MDIKFEGEFTLQNLVDFIKDLLEKIFKFIADEEDWK